MDKGRLPAANDEPGTAVSEPPAPMRKPEIRPLGPIASVTYRMTVYRFR
jgi:hypothetical protein